MKRWNLECLSCSNKLRPYHPPTNLALPSLPRPVPLCPRTAGPCWQPQEHPRLCARVHQRTVPLGGR